MILKVFYAGYDKVTSYLVNQKERRWVIYGWYCSGPL